MIQSRVNKNSVVFFFFFILSFFCSTSVSFAQEKQNGSSYVLEPAFQEVVISNSKPEVTTSIKIKNTTNQAETFEVFGIEFPSTQHFGSLQYLDFSQSAIKQQPNYLRFDANQFVVDPQKEREISLRISDRADLRPGGTYAAVVVRAVNKSATAQQPVLPAFASMLLIRKIDGEIRNLSLTNLGGSKTAISVKIPDSVDVTFQNNGNVHLIPRGEIIVEDIFGRILKQGTLNEESFYVLPDTQRTISVALHKSQWSFPVMLITIRAFGSSETTSYATEYSYLYISPILIIATLLIISAVIYKLKKNKSKKPQTKVEIHIEKIEEK